MCCGRAWPQLTMVPLTTIAAVIRLPHITALHKINIDNSPFNYHCKNRHFVLLFDKSSTDQSPFSSTPIALIVLQNHFHHYLIQLSLSLPNDVVVSSSSLFQRVFNSPINISIIFVFGHDNKFNLARTTTFMMTNLGKFQPAASKNSNYYSLIIMSHFMATFPAIISRLHIIPRRQFISFRVRSTSRQRKLLINLKPETILIFDSFGYYLTPPLIPHCLQHLL